MKDLFYRVNIHEYFRISHKAELYIIYYIFTLQTITKYIRNIKMQGKTKPPRKSQDGPKIIRKKRGNLTCAYCKNYNDGFCINWHINISDNETPCQDFELSTF